MSDLQSSYSMIPFSARWVIALVVGFVGLWWMLPFALSFIGEVIAGWVPSDNIGDQFFLAAFLLATVAFLAFPAYVFVATFRKVGVRVRLGLGIATTVLLAVYLACLLVVPISCHLGLDQHAPPHCHTLLEAASHLH